MLKPLVISLFIFASIVQAGENFKLLATCTTYDGKPVAANDLQKHIRETLNSQTPTVTENIQCGGGGGRDFTVPNDRGLTTTKNLLALDVPQNLVFQYMNGGEGRPKNVLEFFKNIQMDFAGGCDILVPTRFSLLEPPKPEGTPHKKKGTHSDQ